MVNQATNANRQDLIGKYINHYGWSDVTPIGKIIGLVGKETVLVQKVEAGENKTKMEFIPGGFSAHCPNQYAQRYDFTETSETYKIRISKAFFRQYKIQDAPVRFYDYNF